MNDDESTLGALDSWQVETEDITTRVAAAIGAAPDLVAELRSMRLELADLRRETAHMVDEIALLRSELSRQPTLRLSPFIPAESLVRLS